MSKTQLHSLLLSGAAIGALAAAAPAFAQAPSASAPAPASALEEVVVTATRQTDTVNRVSLSVAAVTQKSLDAQGVKQTATDVILHVFPENVAKSVAEGQVLQIVGGIARQAGRVAAVEQLFRGKQGHDVKSLAGWGARVARCCGATQEVAPACDPPGWSGRKRNCWPGD